MGSCGNRLARPCLAERMYIVNNRAQRLTTFEGRPESCGGEGSTIRGEKTQERIRWKRGFPSSPLACWFANTHNIGENAIVCARFDNQRTLSVSLWKKVNINRYLIRLQPVQTRGDEVLSRGGAHITGAKAPNFAPLPSFCFPPSLVTILSMQRPGGYIIINND